LGPKIYGHFGTGTLRRQDISAPMPKCPLDTSALFHQCRSVLVPKCPSAEVSGHRYNTRPRHHNFSLIEQSTDLNHRDFFYTHVI